MKHTNRLRPIGSDDDTGDYAIVDSRDCVVGEAYHRVGSDEHRDAKANAQLWASAPELLEALEAVEWIEVHISYGKTATACAWCSNWKITGHADDCQRQAAIAKARGEQ